MARIAPEIIEQIAAANDIVDVVGGYFPLKRAGSTFRALCPFHQEKTPSFHVNPHRQSYHCFGCGVGGSVFRFVMAYENIDFVTAVRRLADRAGIKVVEEELTAEEDQRLRMRKRLLMLHRDAAEWFHRNLRKTTAAGDARAYLKGRGLNLEIAEAWKIGYAPDSWNAFGDWAEERGFSPEEILRSGLVKPKGDEELEIASPQSVVRRVQWYDRFRDRVMFPICNDIGEVIAFSGRILSSEAQAAKYVNSPETLLFSKGNVLFGMHKSKRALINSGAAIVCEGQLDLITAFEAGVENVIAPQGTAFTEKQARILKRFVREVILCFDSDRAGEQATERSLASLLDANLAVRVAVMPDGHDPDSLIREKGAPAFVERIAQARDFFDYQIDRHAGTPEFRTPRGKVELARRLATSVSLLTDQVMREAVANQLCTRLEISSRDFHAMLAQPKKQPSLTPKSAPAVEPLKFSKTMGLLCLLALQDPVSRAWLLQQTWESTIGPESGAEMLGKILSADLRAGDPSSISSFLTGLSATEEAGLALLLLEKTPGHPEAVVRDCWRDIVRRDLRSRQEALAARLRSPTLTSAEITKLQQEVLDLQKQLTDIARPLSLES